MPLILRSFSKLSQDVGEIARRGVSQLYTKAYAAANSLYESVTGEAATGASRRDIRSHDHTANGDGVYLPRGAIYSFDLGEESTLTAGWCRDVTTMGAWEKYLAGREPHFYAYVTPGLDPSVNAVGGSPCALEARALVDVTLGPATSLDLRFYNVEGQTYSSATTISSSGLQWVSWSDVPFDTGGGLQSWDVEVKGNGTGPLTSVSIYSLVLAETRQATQPAEAGATDFDALTRP